MTKIIKVIFSSLISIFLFFLTSIPVSAATLEVPVQYSTIQSAIDVAQDGDTINVAAGTYHEIINFNDKAISIIGENKDITIIDGTGYGQSVVTLIWSNPIWNPEDWEWPTGPAPQQSLENFTIRGGDAQEGLYSYGGGINILHASPLLKNIIVTNNYVSLNNPYGGPHLGGGIAVRGSANTIIDNCEIVDNHATRGGGLYVGSSNITVNKCYLARNMPIGGAGLGSAISHLGSTGIYKDLIVENQGFDAIEIASGNNVLPDITHAPVTFENCLIRNNAAITPIWIGHWVKATFKNCEISHNSGNQTGAIYTVDNVHLVLNQVTMVGNAATVSPGVGTIQIDDERFYNDASITILNSILWGNIGDYQILPPDTSLYGDFTPVEQFINYSIIQGGYPRGNSILDIDPLFVNASINDYRLTSGSPAIDSGDPNSTFDPDGSRADMGAYPFFHLPPTPTERLNNLINLVQTFNLQQGIENSLDAKLDAAVDTLNDVNANNDQAAINSLQAFINAVEAQRGSKITNEQADILIQEAQEMISYLIS